MPPQDDVLPAEEQPLPAAVSPTTNSPGYIPESDPEEDPEEDDEEDPEEDPADYPADGGDDDDDESSDDYEDDNDDVEEDEDKEQEEEHPAPLDSIPPPIHRVTARTSIRDQPPTPFWFEAEVDRLLAIRTPPPSPLTPLSSLLPQIPSPPLPVSPPPPASPTYPLGYRAAMIRSDAPPLGTPPSGTPPLLPIPAPTSSPPLLLPSTDHRADMPKVCLPPRKRLCIALGLREIRRDLSEIQDIDEIYGRLDDAQDDRSLISGRLNMLYRDRRAYARTALLMEIEARLSREAWVQSMDASDIDRSEVRALRTIVLAQQAEIGALRVADRT
ncbi:hypothetical protein Tco_0903714, partial [Tanacetum coccineum]